MERITYEEYRRACKILEVNPKLSFEKIKKAYRDLVKKYHPDVLNNNDRIREIISAYKTIKNYQEKTDNDNEYTRLRNEKIAILNSRLKYEKVSLDKNEYKWFYQKLENLLKDMELIQKELTICSSAILIDELFDKGREKIENFYYEIRKEYMNQNHIPVDFWTEEFLKEEYRNFQVSIEEFVKTLEKIKERYKQVVGDYTDIIGKETEKYKTYAGYDDIQKQIEKIKEKYRKIEKNKNNDDLMKEMHQEIEMTFKRYFDYLSEIKRMKRYADAEDIEDLNDLEDKIFSPDFFDKIKKYRNKYGYINNEFRKQEIVIQKIYQDLRERANKELEKHAFTTDMSTYYYILQIERQVLDVISKAKRGIIPLDSLMLITNVTFKPGLNDINILQSVYNNQNTVVTDNLYINNSSRMTENNILYWLENHNNENYFMTKINYGTLLKKPIELDDIASDYMLFQKFLDIAEFVGYEKGKTLENKLLYRYEKMALSLREGKFVMDRCSSNLYNGDKKLSEAEMLLFQDKKYITYQLLEQISQEIKMVNKRTR